MIPNMIRRDGTEVAVLGAEVVVRILSGNETTLRHHFWEVHWDYVEKLQVLECSIVLFLAGILCSAAGIGGGGIYVAILMVVGGLTPHNAVPLSKAVVFFGAVASLIVNLRRLSRGQGRDASMYYVIDFEACRVVVPAALIGTFLGVLLNWHAGDAAIVVMLSVLLLFMTVMVMREAFKQHYEEDEEEKAELSMQVQAEIQASLKAEAKASASTDRPTTKDQLAEAPANVSLARRRSIREEACLNGDGQVRPQPTRQDVLLAGVLLFVVILSGVLRFHMRACQEEKQSEAAGQEPPTHGACRHPIVATLFAGHMEVWMSDQRIAMLMQLIALSVPLWSCSMLAYVYGNEAHLKAGWSIRKVVMYQVVAVTTGTLAGLVGVGGGLIFSPFFLLSGMDPALAVGTSSTCVLFTSSSTTIQYVFTDRIIMSLAIVYGLVTLLASWAGTSLVHMLQDAFARRSHITFIVAFSVALSAALALFKLATGHIQ